MVPGGRRETVQGSFWCTTRSAVDRSRATMVVGKQPVNESHVPTPPQFTRVPAPSHSSHAVTGRDGLIGTTWGVQSAL